MGEIEKTIETFLERDRAEKVEALKSEKKAVPVKVDCKVAKEIFYQTAVLKNIQNELNEIKELLGSRKMR
ncbi:hypothetical protein [Eubacterium barkeri]|uniref:Uncharacterized protein n=1 Tax=Eubacterium barkeri TaxID=1528 RepID=A0A1H3BIZ0_EUBBA|nr:hypothetical protein [Eubacterium barkeri]SDX41049.1 hypothetical protein SAMN04488579_10272 [Eubacterium barkeri]